MNRIYQQYKDRAAFYIVYIEEAHASDGWQLPVNERQGVIFAKPQSQQQRENVADACVRRLNIQIPALVDGIDNTVEKAYTGWPDRIYVIDKHGVVTHKSAPGPYGFDPVQMEEALKRVL